MEKERHSVIESLGLRSAFDAKGEGDADEKRRDITEAYFGTSSDPDQIPVSKSTLERLKQLSDYCINCAYDGDSPVSWTIVIPTSKKLMEGFLKQELTEREMFEKTEVGDKEALYLCSAFTVQEFRGKGIAKILVAEQVGVFLNENPDMQIFAWVYSDEGKRLLNSVEKTLGKKIKTG